MELEARVYELEYAVRDLRSQHYRDLSAERDRERRSNTLILLMVYCFVLGWVFGRKQQQDDDKGDD